MPIVARGGGLDFAIIVAGGVGELGVRRTYADARPILCCSAVIHCGQATPIERIIVDACHAIRDGDARKTTAIIERIRANARHAIGDRDAGKSTAISERRRANGCTAGNHNRFQSCGNIATVITIRRSTKDITKMRIGSAVLACPYKRNCDTCKATALIERIRANARHVITDYNACKTIAIIERILIYFIILTIVTVWQG